MLVNWRVEYTNDVPSSKQPPDYYVADKPYWFFQYFEKDVQVDVVDTRSFPALERFEKEKLHFYIWQTVKVLPKLKKYDLILSHGMQSGVVLCIFRKVFHVKTPPHVVFDIGSFNSAKESGWILKLMQFASKSIDGLIYHTSKQIEYYQKHHPWLVNKARFIRFGTDLDFFNPANLVDSADKNQYILCIGYAKRDWDTLLKAYKMLNTNVNLRLIGHVDDHIQAKNVEQFFSIPIKQLMNQIYNALFCVLPLENFNYSFGQMTLLQQMALGKAVITAKVPSMVDYVEDMKTAILYQPHNVDDLALKMKYLLDNPDKRDEISVNGRKMLLKICNEEIMAKEIESFIYQLITDQ